MRGFSFASLILGYFLVGGGMFTAPLAASALGTTSEVVMYLLLAAGAFLGGFVAARASRGSTILEPALGAIAVVATVVGLGASTEIGKLLWGVAQDQTLKLIAAIGGISVAGALVGAFVSERLLGDATRSSIPWTLYAALSTYGACMLVMIIGLIAYVAGDFSVASLAERPPPSSDVGDRVATMILIGMGAGCLLAGVAIGASSRTRPLIAAMLGGGAGVTGFWALVLHLLPRDRDDKDTITALAVFAIGGCLITLLGTILGWVAVGRRAAD